MMYKLMADAVLKAWQT